MSVELLVPVYTKFGYCMVDMVKYEAHLKESIPI
jgi:hypothetical protein